MTTQPEKPKYPTFYDEVLAHVPMDRWVTFKELWEILKPRGLHRQCVKTSLWRARKDGLVLCEDTGVRKRARGALGARLIPVYRYIRLVEARLVRKPSRKKGAAGKPGAACPAARRTRRGEKHNMNRSLKKERLMPHTTKLTPEKVREIRRLKGDITATARAVMFGVHPDSIRNIDKRITWRWVSDEEPVVGAEGIEPSTSRV